MRDAESLTHGRRIIGNEHVGLGGEAMQHCLSLGPTEIEREALLVAGFQEPGEIVLAHRIARQVRQVAVGIACYGRLDLDHVGAEIRQHGGGRGRCDETRAVQYLEAFKDALFHVGAAPVTLAGLVPVCRNSRCARPDHLAHVGVRCNRYSSPDISAALPPAAAVLIVTVCSVANRER